MNTWLRTVVNAMILVAGGRKTKEDISVRPRVVRVIPAPSR